MERFLFHPEHVYFDSPGIAKNLRSPFLSPFHAKQSEIFDVNRSYPLISISTHSLASRKQKIFREEDKKENPIRKSILVYRFQSSSSLNDNREENKNRSILFSCIFKLVQVARSINKLNLSKSNSIKFYKKRIDSSRKRIPAKKKKSNKMHPPLINSNQPYKYTFQLQRLQKKNQTSQA